MIMKIILKPIDEQFLIDINKKNITQSDVDEDNNFYTFIKDNNYYIYVSKLFFTGNENADNKIIQSVLTCTFFHGGNSKFSNELFNLKSNDYEHPWMLLFLLKCDLNKKIATNKILSFIQILNELSIYSTFVESLKETIYLKKIPSLNWFLNFLNLNNILENNDCYDDLIFYFQQIKTYTFESSLANHQILLQEINTTTNPGLRGNIFQLLCGNILFNQNDDFYYNTKGGGNAGLLYPDLLFKYKNYLFICDTKFYKNDNDINPHKEFFYNILLSHSGYKTCGILLLYEKEDSTHIFSITKRYKLESHCYYAVSINIKLALDNQSDCSIIRQIADNILDTDTFIAYEDIIYKINDADPMLQQFLDK
jgi:hypothetical protein